MQCSPTRLSRLSKILALVLVVIASPALANPELVVDVDSGQVLIKGQSTASWYPAALTTLMTVYVALHAERDGRISMDTPLVVSARAAGMPAAKMGLRPGVRVTLDNALKLLMVKSPNDVAVTVAEGVSGTVEAFADEMNAAAARLGMKELHFVNPNGLPDKRQVTSARDMAMLGRALLKEFPEKHDLFGIGALQLGDQIMSTHNSLIGRYPGADGMKTGFTCAAGLNVVASATRDGRRLIVVVLGSSSARDRLAKATALLDKGFAKKDDASASVETIESLPSPGVKAAPDMHAEICSSKGGEEVASAGEIEEWIGPIVATGGRGGARGASIYYRLPHRPASHPRALALAAMRPVHFDPLPIFIGPKPGWTDVLAAASPPDAGTQHVTSAPATTGEAGAAAVPGAFQVGDKDKTAPNELIARMVPLSAVEQPSASVTAAIASPINSEIVAQPPAAARDTQTPGRVPLHEQGGVFVIPVLVNSAIRLNFILDSGSADVSVPADVVLTLMRTGTISSSDFVGQQTYKLADGSTVPSVTFIIRSLKVGNREIENVTASVTGVEGSLLLGQTFLSRFKSWSIDNQRETLVFN